MPKNSIQSMMTIGISIKKKKLILLTKKLNLLTIHKELSKLDSNKFQMDYDATSL